MDRVETRAAIVVVVSVGVGYLLWRRYHNRLEAHQYALKNVDPARIEQWNLHHEYDKALRGLKGEFRHRNTVEFHHPTEYDFQGRVVRSAYTERIWIHAISPAEFWAGIQSQPARWDSLSVIFDKAGHTAEEAYGHLFTTSIPSAGPHPIPSEPWASLHILGWLAASCAPVAFFNWQDS